ncbi:MAG: Nif3-like dinuclear metal center hexameric protein, partial [Legionella sp.]
MITRTELDSYLQDLLLSAKFSDYAPNGLQIEGKAQIARICTAVTASDEVISQAIQFKA